MMLYVLPPTAAAGPPSPWSTILCDDGRPSTVRGVSGGQQEPTVANSGRLTYKRNASNNRRVKAWLNAVQKNNRPPPPRKPSVDTAGPEVRSKFGMVTRFQGKGGVTRTALDVQPTLYTFDI